MNKWDERFMQLAETVAGWSSCYQENRHVGAVIVKDKRIKLTFKIEEKNRDYPMIVSYINGICANVAAYENDSMD